MDDHGIGEFDLIRRLRRATSMPAAATTSVVAGIGDDAAVLKLTPGCLLLVTTDLLLEHIHFDLACTTYRQLGYKAAMANLSDIAAMGGVPRYVLIAMALTARERPSDVAVLYAGIHAACRPAGTAVVGGDTSASRSGLFLSLTVLGEAVPQEVLRRSGACTGDLIYVTGTLGDAQAGLELLRGHKTGPRRTRLSARDKAFLIARHVTPTARLAEAQRLAKGRLASAAIDLSDGLAGDLRHVCEESGVGALVDVRRLPLSPSLLAYAQRQRQDPVAYALSGGEDYELLFTVPPTQVARVEALIRRRQLRATAIGAITPRRQGLRLIGADGAVRPLTSKGYEHRLGELIPKGRSMPT
jgi:thiamine-monophosphate kinase